MGATALTPNAACAASSVGTTWPLPGASDRARGASCVASCAPTDRQHNLAHTGVCGLGIPPRVAFSSGARRGGVFTMSDTLTRAEIISLLEGKAREGSVPAMKLLLELADRETRYEPETAAS